MSGKAPPLHRNDVPTNSGARWGIFFLVILTSGISAYTAVIIGAFSAHQGAFNLSVSTSAICFALAMALVFQQKNAFAFLLAAAIAPIYLLLVTLYFETTSFRIELANKVAEIIRFIDDKIHNPQPALEKAIREGSIRKATATDVKAFQNAYIEKKYKNKNTPVPDNENALAVGEVDLSHAYVVLKAFTYPSGLVNKYRVVFFTPEGVPEPKGDIGHSAVYDFNTLTVGCTAARTGGFSC
jgi:hypothetical protein